MFWVAAYPRQIIYCKEISRRKRNAADYLGDGVEPDALAECRQQANFFKQHVKARLKREHPGMLRPASS